MMWLIFDFPFDVPYLFQELRDMHKGRGERSTESAAAMVGLSLPENYDPDK